MLPIHLMLLVSFLNVAVELVIVIEFHAWVDQPCVLNALCISNLVVIIYLRKDETKCDHSSPVATIFWWPSSSFLMQGCSVQYHAGTLLLLLLILVLSKQDMLFSTHHHLCFSL